MLRARRALPVACLVLALCVLPPAAGATEAAPPDWTAAAAAVAMRPAPDLWQGTLLTAAAAPPVDWSKVRRTALALPHLPLEMAHLEPPPPPKGQLIKERAQRKLGAKYDLERIGERGIGGGLNFYSLEKEVALGRELAAELEFHVRLLDDARVNEYINRLGQKLARNSDAQVAFTIKIIDSDEINAYALPGGFFYLNSGLILATESEAELAGVMAHEIAHVAARHATRNATRSEIWNLASIPLMFVGGPIGYAVRQVAGLAVPMTFLKFGRNAEREADLLGLEYQYVSGYDPVAFVDFFERLSDKRKRNFLARAFSSHPMTGDRIRRSQEMIAEVLPEREEYVVTTSEYEEMKARLFELNRARLIDEGRAEPVLRRRTD